jgi:hypothetical protein
MNSESIPCLDSTKTGQVNLADRNDKIGTSASPLSTHKFSHFKGLAETYKSL